MAARPCLGCSKPTRNGSRCHTCEQARQRTRNANRQHYKGNWQKLSREARQAQPWCTYCGATTDLTLDHVTPRSTVDGLVVACRSCNARKSNR